MALTAKQTRIATMIGRGLTQAEAGRAVGLSQRTVEKWMSPSGGVPEMRELARQIREETYEPGALDTLRQLLSSKSEAIRLGAAKALLAAPPDVATADKPTAPSHVTLNIWRDPLPETTPDEPSRDDHVIDAEVIEVEPAELPRASGPSVVGISDRTGVERRPNE